MSPALPDFMLVPDTTFGESGYTFMLEGMRTDERRIGMLSPSFPSLAKEPARLVRRAEPKVLSIKGISSWMEGRFEPMRGSIFLGSSSLKDFFLVCCVGGKVHKRADWCPP
jgi:hypothetical protein